MVAHDDRICRLAEQSSDGRHVGWGRDQGGLEGMQMSQVQTVQGTLCAGLRVGAGGEGRDVVWRGTGKVGSGREQQRQILVAAMPQVIGQGAGRRRGGSVTGCRH